MTLNCSEPCVYAGSASLATTPHDSGLLPTVPGIFPGMLWAMLARRARAGGVGLQPWGGSTPCRGRVEKSKYLFPRTGTTEPRARYLAFEQSALSLKCRAAALLLPMACLMADGSDASVEVTRNILVRFSLASQLLEEAQFLVAPRSISRPEVAARIRLRFLRSLKSL